MMYKKYISIIVFLLVAAPCALAHSQDRLYFEHLPDLDLLEPVAVNFERGFDDHSLDNTTSGASLRLDGALRGWGDLGPAVEEEEGNGELQLGLGAGVVRNEHTFATLRTDTTLLLDGDVRGHHRARGRLDTGKPEEGSFGLAFTGELDVRHSGERGWMVRPAWIGSGPFSMRSASVSVLPLLRGGDPLDDTAALKITYVTRSLTYDGGYGVRGLTTQGLRAGLGFLAHSPDVRDGWFGFLNLGAHATTLELDGPDSAIGQEVETIELDVVSVEGMVLDMMDVLIVLDGTFGATWRYSRTTGEEDYALTWKSTVAARFTDGTIGVASARQLVLAPDGSRFLSELRLEMPIVYDDPETPIGAELRWALSSITDPEAIFEDDWEEAWDRTRFGVHSAWFVRLANFKLGAYHAAEYDLMDEVAAMRLSGEAGWRHELGGFLRTDLGW